MACSSPACRRRMSERSSCVIISSTTGASDSTKVIWYGVGPSSGRERAGPEAGPTSWQSPDQ